jgi:hypothetical protein
MGFLGDIFKDALKDAKYAVKDEIRSEIRSDARDAVRGAIQGTKEKVGEAGDAVKDSLTKKDENPATAPVQAAPAAETQVQAAPIQAAPVQTAPADTVGEAMANQLDAAQPAVQIMNNIMNDNGIIGKLANAAVDAKMTDQEKAEMKESLETLSDPTKAEEVKQALRDNSEQIDAKLKEQGYNTEQMTAALNQSAAQTQEMQNPEKML